MRGKTVVITGATSGIGEVAADRLAQDGAKIVFVARDSERGERTLKHLRAIAPDAEHAAYYADLSNITEMKRVAGEIAAAEPKIDVLINNAGALFNTRQETHDGLEMTFAVNHMAYFVITNLLLKNLKAAGAARVVSTSSDAHKGAKLNLADLQSSRSYSGFSVYSRSKLMNILFTRELARQMDGSGVTANCLHPGFVASRFGDGSGGIMSFGLKMAKNFAISPEQGAQTIIYLAGSPQVEGQTGGYYYKCKPATPTREARNDADAGRLWTASAKLAGFRD